MRGVVKPGQIAPWRLADGAQRSRRARGICRDVDDVNRQLRRYGQPRAWRHGPRRLRASPRRCHLRERDIDARRDDAESTPAPRHEWREGIDALADNTEERRRISDVEYRRAVCGVDGHASRISLDSLSPRDHECACNHISRHAKIKLGQCHQKTPKLSSQECRPPCTAMPCVESTMPIVSAVSHRKVISAFFWRRHAEAGSLPCSEARMPMPRSR